MERSAERLKHAREMEGTAELIGWHHLIASDGRTVVRSWMVERPPHRCAPGKPAREKARCLTCVYIRLQFANLTDSYGWTTAITSEGSARRNMLRSAAEHTSDSRQSLTPSRRPRIDFSFIHIPRATCSRSMTARRRDFSLPPPPADYFDKSHSPTANVGRTNAGTWRRRTWNAPAC